MKTRQIVCLIIAIILLVVAAGILVVASATVRHLDVGVAVGFIALAFGLASRVP